MMPGGLSSIGAAMPNILNRSAQSEEDRALTELIASMGQQAPRPKSFGIADAIPLALAGLIGHFAGASNKDIGQFGRSYMGANQGVRNQQNEADQAEQQKKQQIAQFLYQQRMGKAGRTRDTADRVQGRQWQLADRSAQNAIDAAKDQAGFDRDKEMLRLNQDFKAAESEKARQAKVNSDSFKSRVKAYTEWTKKAFDLTSEEGRKNAFDALTNAVNTGTLDEDSREAVVKALSGETFTASKSKAQIAGIELTNEQKRFRNEMDKKYGETLKKLEVQGKKDAHAKAVEFLRQAPIKLADQLKRTAIAVAHLNERVRAAGSSETLARWTAANKPLIEQQITEINNLKEAAAKAEENQALGYADKEGKPLPNAAQMKQADVDAIQKAEFMIPLLNDQIEKAVKSVPVAPKPSSSLSTGSGALTDAQLARGYYNAAKTAKGKAAIVAEWKKQHPGVPFPK